MKPMPTIVFFNGGSFFHGNRSSSDSICQALAQRGFAVINADFRDISGDIGIVDELKDVLAMLNWMNFNRGRFGFDLDRCYVMGTSYGALMATWFSLFIPPYHFCHFCLVNLSSIIQKLYRTVVIICDNLPQQG